MVHQGSNHLSTYQLEPTTTIALTCQSTTTVAPAPAYPAALVSARSLRILFSVLDMHDYSDACMSTLNHSSTGICNRSKTQATAKRPHMDATAHVGVDETCLRLRTRRRRRLPARGMGLQAPWQAPPRSLRDLRAKTAQPANKHKQAISSNGDENRRNR